MGGVGGRVIPVFVQVKCEGHSGGRGLEGVGALGIKHFGATQRPRS